LLDLLTHRLEPLSSYHEPCDGSWSYADGYFHIVPAIELIHPAGAPLLTDIGRIGQPRVIKRQLQLLFDLAIQRIIDHCQALML